MISVAARARMSAFADIEDSVRGMRIANGENSAINSFVKIKPAGGGALVIGGCAVINSGCALYTGNRVVIGAN